MTTRLLFVVIPEKDESCFFEPCFYTVSYSRDGQFDGIGFHGITVFVLDETIELCVVPALIDCQGSGRGGLSVPLCP